MNYLENNLHYLKKHNLKIYNTIEKIIYRKKYDLEKFEYYSTKDGIGTLAIENNGKKIRLNSLYSPQKEAEKWSQQFNYNNINISVVMFGLANGVFVNELLRKLDDEAIVIIMEPDSSLFIYSLMNFDMKSILSDVRLKLYIKNINDNEFYSAIHYYVNAIMIPSQIVCSYPKFEQLYCEEADKFMKIIDEKYRLEISLSFGLKDEYKNGIINTFKNLVYIKDSNYSSELIGKIPNEIPVIIVSAGPSLDKNIKELKKAENKAVILATDTAVKQLVVNDINFDAIISVDTMKKVEYINQKKYCNKIIFSGIKTSHNVLDSNYGKKIWIVSSRFMCTLYKESNLSFSAWTNGGSVATEAFNLAVEMGAKKIILVGQDLAFEGDYTHSGKIVDIEKYSQQDIKYVEGINGDMVRTRSDWVRYLDWFSYEIKRLNGSIEVVDATEGGAKIAGTRIMKLSDAISQYCVRNFEFEKIILKMEPTFSENEYNILLDRILYMSVEIDEIEKKSKYGIELSNKMLYMLNNEEYNKIIETECINRIKDINDFIQAQLVYTIIDDYMETKINGIMKVNNFTENLKKDKIITYELSKSAFKAILETVEYVRPIMEKEFNRIKNV